MVAPSFVGAMIGGAVLGALMKKSKRFWIDWMMVTKSPVYSVYRGYRSQNPLYTQYTVDLGSGGIVPRCIIVMDAMLCTK